ncbi:poly [ADP-ribose] polymerase 1-like isoform X2 [Artemia franciscana]|uniref:poly [ADP-ribose] polymerase 1-like isoform X2 n=1 Tax=Artemia franciscana TaxID=6661 RepID=UPI0032DB4164
MVRMLRKRKPETAEEVDGPKKKKAEEGATKKGTKEEKEESEILKKQSDLIYKFRDNLQQLSRNELQDLLEYNGQEIPSGNMAMMDRIADIMAFGALEPCPECGGQLTFRSGHGYVCLGNITEWTKCTYTTKKPKRKPFKVPDELKKEYSFLNNYKYKPRERYIRDVPPPTPAIGEPRTKPPKSSKPLKDMSFMIVGDLSRKAEEVKDIIAKYGGKITTRMTADCVAVISSQGKLEEGDKVFDKAESRGVYVVTEDFLDDIPKADNINALLEEKNIATWKTANVKMRLSLKEEKNKIEKKPKYSKENERVRLQLKGGGVVDPESGLDSVAHVYKDKDGTLYSAVLGQVDIQRDKNSFYKLQVLQSDKGGKYWVFRSWGRIGTTIGGNKVEEMDSVFDAKQHFERLYAEKSGNEWSDRHNFVKLPDKMYPLELDYGADVTDSIEKMSVEASKSSLPKPVKELICLLFDIDNMKKQMAEFELDLTKMPLGKLSRKQIEQAYSVLKEVEELLKNKEGDAESSNKGNAKFIDASNRFFTLIPHDFGLNQPPLLDNHEIVKSKLEMLDSLMEIEVAYKLLKSGEEDKTKDPIDRHYEQLNSKIEVLEKDTEEFKIIEKYVRNTHAETHSQYSLEIEDVFKVQRNGEDKRYKPFSKLGNKKLLWHGSRLTNMAGIMSQGLKIAPPEAPVTGYMFGKGIYFADMVSKSANYCYTSPANSLGFLLLCEVALGKMYERTDATYIEKLPKGYQSVKGLGQTEPDPAESIKMKKDVEVPLGKAVKSGVKKSQLLYNEFIVYDVAQVNIQYLLKTKFSYKKRR